MCVSTCLKGGVGGRKSQRCQLFTVHCSRFRRLEGLLVVVDEGGGSWGQSQGCYLGNNCKIASSPLLVMVGFFSLCCFLFFAQPCEAHLAIQRLGPIRAQGNGLFLLYFVFVYLKPPPPKKLFFSIFSSNSAPVLPPYPSRKCSAWLAPRTAEQKWSHHSFLVTDCLEQMRLFLLLSNQQTL